MANVVIYARYSSSAQTEQSIEGQLRVCREFAEHSGHVIVNEYIDRAMSGTNDERPDFLQMLSDSSKKQFDFIIVYKLDRFARNQYDSVFYKNKLKQNGVKVLSATEAISDTQEGRLVEGILEIMAEMYSHDLSQKVKRGLKESALKGTFTGGNLLFGYKAVDKRIQIDQEKANIIRYVFEQYANGKGKKEIISELNNKGFRTNKGKQFTINSFYNTLRNRKYIGENLFNGILSENSYPPIIDRDIFERVQVRLDQNKHAPASAKVENKYILYGKAFCGHCGTKLVGVSGTSKTTERHRYYACSKQYKNKSCDKQYEKKDQLEKYVVQLTLDHIYKEDIREEIANGVIEMYKNSISEKRIKEYEKNIAQIDRELDKCAEIILKAESDSIINRINEKSRALDIQRTDLQKELTKLKLANSIKHTKEDILGWLDIFRQGDVLDSEYRERIINIFINAIFVFDTKIVTYYNIIKDNEQISFEAMLINIEENENIKAEANYNKNNGVLISCDTLRHYS